MVFRTLTHNLPMSNSPSHGSTKSRGDMVEESGFLEYLDGASEPSAAVDVVRKTRQCVGRNEGHGRRTSTTRYIVGWPGQLRRACPPPSAVAGRMSCEIEMPESSGVTSSPPSRPAAAVATRPVPSRDDPEIASQSLRSTVGRRTSPRRRWSPCR